MSKRALAGVVLLLAVTVWLWVLVFQRYGLHLPWWYW